MRHHMSISGILTILTFALQSKDLPLHLSLYLSRGQRKKSRKFFNKTIQFEFFVCNMEKKRGIL